MRAARAQVALAVALAIAGAARGQEDPDVAEVARAEEALRGVGDRLLLVENEYARDDPSELLELRRRFGEGETQYLLGEFANAAALLYDVADSPLYRTEPTRPDALLYLGDALYRQGSWPESRRYFKELAELRGKHLQDALLRLIELSEKVRDPAGIEEAWAALVAKAGAPGRLKPEVQYLHAKWLARRTDRPDGERVASALEAFRLIPAESDFGPQARYFEGVLLVQRGELGAAAAAFEALLALPQIARAPAPSALPSPQVGGAAGLEAERARRHSRLRDLALLAGGRILFEQDQPEKAAALYSRIERESESYVDALYELSACWQRLGDPEKALRATDLLLLVTEDSVMAPEARLQQATLQARLKRYPRAIAQFEQLALEVRPVRDRVQALVKVEDPVAYYDELLARGDKSLDATQLLPESARRYVTGEDAAHARVIVSDLGAGHKTLDEAREILQRLDEALRAGKLDLFPTLQEGNLRAVEVENALVRLEGQLTAVETRRAEGAQATTARLAAARAARQALDAQAALLPDSAAAFEERRGKALVQVAELERQAFRLGSDVDSMAAQLAAAEKWQRDTAGARRGDAAAVQAEREFSARLAEDRRVVAQLEAERAQVRRALEVTRAQVTAATAGGLQEENLRAAYLQAVRDEEAAAHELHEKLPPADRVLLARVDAAMQRVADLRKRALAVRAALRERGRGRLTALRSRLEREARALESYGQEVAQLEGGTRQLLGRIATQSFTRVFRVFDDLLLRADLGVIDAAWAMKKERTDSVTELEEQRRKGLKAIQDEFGEVLEEDE